MTACRCARRVSGCVIFVWFRYGRWPHVLKRSVRTLRQPEFTILYIEDGIASEIERESLKEIASQEPVLAEVS